MLRIHGTPTSPYVRRVRVVALELGLAHELVDTASEAGLAALRTLTPIWKVPVAEIDGAVVFDSGVINEALLRRHGPGALAAHDPADLELRNLITVIDGALDSLINCFYLGRDGVGADTASYLQKHQDRAASALTWLDARAEAQGQDGWLTPAKAWGLAEIALVTSLAWMRFRGTYPVERHPALLRCLVRHAERESMVATAPPA